MIDIDPNDLIMGSGAKSASFPTKGTTVTGFISRKPETMQQTHITTREPLFYKDNQPKLMVRILLLTEEHEDDDDNGERALYAKVGGGIMAAIRDALKAAGAERLEVGGKLAVRYVKDGVAKGALDPPKIYEAKYKLPAVAPVGKPDNGKATSSVTLQEPEEVDFAEIPF